ncbi:Transposase [Caenorhabditis elegans]|uniref:Transposase n=1 Tax=Caenorhabditis elegans TaxID=6239 RepID=Q9XXG0_CAEEL|nr:Transposase [Caenorhabditis elegans]CAA19489.3 Transposase [Caenorhabditis elegans]|eukprot:NP_502692.3 Uncharacterized protein CELE_Y37A1B.4 [Caenorhabditis elegans]
MQQFGIKYLELQSFVRGLENEFERKEIEKKNSEFGTKTRLEEHWKYELVADMVKAEFGLYSATGGRVLVWLEQIHVQPLELLSTDERIRRQSIGVTILWNNILVMIQCDGNILPQKHQGFYRFH